MWEEVPLTLYRLFGRLDEFSSWFCTSRTVGVTGLGVAIRGIQTVLELEVAVTGSSYNEKWL